MSGAIAVLNSFQGGRLNNLLEYECTPEDSSQKDADQDVPVPPPGFEVQAGDPLPADELVNQQRENNTAASEQQGVEKQLLERDRPLAQLRPNGKRIRRNEHNRDGEDLGDRTTLPGFFPESG